MYIENNIQKENRNLFNSQKLFNIAYTHMQKSCLFYFFFLTVFYQLWLIMDSGVVPKNNPSILLWTFQSKNTV